MDARAQEMAGALLASLQQLAGQLERAQQQTGGRISKASAVAQMLQEFGVPAAPVPTQGLMAAQLALVGKVFPQLQERARQMVEAQQGPAALA